MIHLYSGDGKGKTTAAVGLAVRALGAGKIVLFAQFLKGSETSEINVLKEHENCIIFRNSKDLGFYPYLDEEGKEEMKRMHTETIRGLFSLISNRDDIFMMVLDEITYVYEQGICQDLGLLTSLLELAASKNVEIVMTGRNPQGHIEYMADYHTECKAIRHVFDKGVDARLGVEY